jgi:HEAT repeats
LAKTGIALLSRKGVKDGSNRRHNLFSCSFVFEGVMERRSLHRTKRIVAGTAAIALLILGGFAWLERAPLLAWYSIHMLLTARDSNRQAWAERVAELDLAAMVKLMDYLRQADSGVCAGVQAALQKMAQRWGPDDSRRAKLVDCLAERFAGLSEPGRQAALESLADLLQTQPAGSTTVDLLPAVTRVLLKASRATGTGVRAAALALGACALSDRHAHADLLHACRELTQTCLSDQAAGNRVQAIRLALRQEIDLVEAVPSLLNDPVPEVRRQAMLAVGCVPTAISTDDLLRWLHDSDPEVRRLCEAALRSRGLRDEHVQLGRLLTDSRPEVRLQVLDLLCRANDLDSGIWLRRLSHDSAPAVRAAAVRVATEQKVRSLTDRLEQMAQNDPCPSVRQLAQYYLTSTTAGSMQQ